MPRPKTSRTPKAPKPKKLSLAARALIPEPPEAAGPDRDLCQKCGAYQRARTPFMPLFVPKGWTGELLVVGERPGQDEDQASGRPFTGRAGQALARMLAAEGYPPETAAMTNSVRCADPENTAPSMEQIRCCRPLLLGALRALNPRVVLGTGNIAARALTNSGQAGVTALRGRLVEVPVLVPEPGPDGPGTVGPGEGTS